LKEKWKKVYESVSREKKRRKRFFGVFWGVALPMSLIDTKIYVEETTTVEKDT
jgi:hypothetical protein